MIKFVTMMNDIAISPKYQTEHGLSFYIEYDDLIYLFDTGQTDKFFENLNQHELNYMDISHIVLSHAHYDHTGGLKTLINKDIKSNLFIGKSFWDKKYSKNENDFLYKGVDFTKQELLNSCISLCDMDNSVKEISSKVYLVTDFERNLRYERIDKKFVVMRENQMIADKFIDEVVLCIDTDNGLVLFVGCGHPGIVNIIETISKKFNKSIYAVFGGFHLNGEDETYIKDVTDYLLNNVEVVGTGHCTGERATKILRESFGEKYKEISVGLEHYLK